MAFNTKKALSATKEVSLEHGGQTLVAQVYVSNFTPAQIKAKAEEASKAARQSERARLKLVKALDTSHSAMLEAKPQDEDAAETAVIAAEDALDEFDRKATETNIRFLSGELASVVASWDVEHEDGEPLPLKAEDVYQSLPWPVISALYEKTQEAVSPSKKS